MNDALGGFNEFLNMPQKRPESRSFKAMEDDWFNLFFGTERGMRVFGDMLILSGYHDTSFTGNSNTFFIEGRKEFVRTIIRIAGLDTAEGLHRLARFEVVAAQTRKAQEKSEEENENAG